MYFRIVACGIVAILFITASSGGSSAPADVDALAPATIPMPINNQEQRPAAIVYENTNPDAKLATLEPAHQLTTPSSIAGSAAQDYQTEPFGLTTTSVSEGPLVAMWSGVEADIRAEGEILTRCRASTGDCPSAAQDFLAIIADGRARSGLARIGMINRAINMAIRPSREDRWTVPLETFATGRGDCKEYAIAKYVALIEAGISKNDVRVIIVHNLGTDENHAVVATRFNGGWIVLDNRWLTLVEDVEMRRVIPLFVFDEDGVKQYQPASSGRG